VVERSDSSVMSSTYLSLHYYFVVSTKHRVERIDVAWRDSLHPYLAGILTNLDAVPERIGGVADHVHLLVGLLATHCVADVLRELKKASSIWVHKEIGLASFAWQGSCYRRQDCLGS
jgi:putative transposase